jgi:hypothetical protein
MKLIDRTVIFIGALLIAARVGAAVLISVNIAPPELPDYEQPPVPAPGYIWTPGYWSYGAEGYFWVPATWIAPPFSGALWTPGYWAWADGAYTWNAGYWGLHVGYYGGINYGFGYTGDGFAGGYWREGHFAYNTSVTNVRTTIVTNVYSQPVAAAAFTEHAHASFNGPGGRIAAPTADQRRAMSAPHYAPVMAQTQHERAASGERSLLASVNHARPIIGAMQRPAASTTQISGLARPPSLHTGATVSEVPRRSDASQVRPAQVNRAATQEREVNSYQNTQHLPVERSRPAPNAAVTRNTVDAAPRQSATVRERPLPPSPPSTSRPAARETKPAESH